jgi:hypothetical protein
MAALLGIPLVFVVALVVISANAGRSGSVGSKDVLVENSSWDGSVFHVKQYLKKNLKDPDSYEGIEWSPVQKLSDGTFSVRHKYRAKNSFGGFVVENQVFVYDAQGNVLSAKDW